MGVTNFRGGDHFIARLHRIFILVHISLHFPLTRIDFDRSPSTSRGGHNHSLSWWGSHRFLANATDCVVFSVNLDFYPLIIEEVELTASPALLHPLLFQSTLRTTHGHSHSSVFPFLVRTAHGRSCPLVFVSSVRAAHGRSRWSVFVSPMRTAHGHSCMSMF